MKYALIIGNNTYDDFRLAQLKTPAADSRALAKTLDDKAIGAFDEVRPLINQTETQVRRAISAFLTNKKPDDLVLLYFSGHGVLDDRGRLYLAFKDTQIDLLKATSIPSSFVADEMDSCRSKRQILILDCCHSGAFARGTKGEQKAITETTFEGSGFGRVVLTASDSTQYALEGDQVIKQSELSLFTHFLLEGLKTGEADANNDGLIALDEWYDYTYARVISETPRQVPHKWSYNQQGDLIIARNPYVKKRVVELPYELLQALESSFVGIRESAVNELGNYLGSRDPEMVELAVSSLQRMTQDDSRRISSLAESLLLEFEEAHAPKEKVDSSGITPEAKPEAVRVSNQKLMFPASVHAGDEPVPVKTTVQSDSNRAAMPVDSTFFWLQWIGIAIVGAFILNWLKSYLYDNTQLIQSFPILFSILAGLDAILQWFVFRKQLRSWWIAANVGAGLGLGLLHELINANSEWWIPDELFAIFLISNFALGTILFWKASQGLKQLSPASPYQPAARFVEADTRQNIFFLTLSTSLILYSLVVFTTAVGLTGPADLFTILLGAANIFVGIAFFLKKEIPRNLGFTALAVASVLYGIMTEINYFSYDFTQSYFAISALLSLSSGIFFASQRETRKDVRFILLSGFLIALSAAQIVIDISGVYNAFSIIAALLAIATAIFFLRSN